MKVVRFAKAWLAVSLLSLTGCGPNAGEPERVPAVDLGTGGDGEATGTPPLSKPERQIKTH
jgi:hypothetical protein